METSEVSTFYYLNNDSQNQYIDNILDNCEDTKFMQMVNRLQLSYNVVFKKFAMNGLHLYRTDKLFLINNSHCKIRIQLKYEDAVENIKIRLFVFPFLENSYIDCLTNENNPLEKLVEIGLFKLIEDNKLIITNEMEKRELYSTPYSNDVYASMISALCHCDGEFDSIGINNSIIFRFLYNNDYAFSSMNNKGYLTNTKKSVLLIIDTLTGELFFKNNINGALIPVNTIIKKFNLNRLLGYDIYNNKRKDFEIIINLRSTDWFIIDQEIKRMNIEQK